MSDLKGLLRQENVLLNLHASCRRDVLGVLAKHASEITGVDASDIKDRLMKREQLGSTGIGNGIAIPHGKIPGLEDMVAIMARLDKPIDFDSVDDRPVDIVFLLLAPEEANAAHLKALSRVARRMRSEDIRQALRGAHSAEALYAIVVEGDKPQAA